MSDASSKIPGALLRYRVMAIITGTFLMVVFVGLVRYPLESFAGVDIPAGLDSALSLVAVVHGWVYMVYLAVTVHLWILMKWGMGRLAYMAAGGVVPLLSFFAERRVRADVTTPLEAAK